MIGLKNLFNIIKLTSRKDLQNGEHKIEQFLTCLAVEAHIAPSTQNQAMNALVFLYKKVLKSPLTEKIDAVRAFKKNKYSGRIDP